MKIIQRRTVIVLFLSCLILISCREKRIEKINPEGQRQADLGNGLFQNPILGGDYPDPSVLKHGDSWYMTHSTFDYAPGLLIWKSKDLVNWIPVGNALNTYLGSVFAPDFIEYRDTFYIYFPVLGRNPENGKFGFNNWVVWSNNPEGPWSIPQNLNVGHIDPGHIADSVGNRYLHLSDGNIVSLNGSGTRAINTPQKIYNGWKYPSDWIVEGFCLESPKLFYKNGYFYLTSAEGGTAGPATSHMVVSARSKTPLGPWEHSPYNPIVKTYSQENHWWSTGHGTPFEGPEGNWYIMFHGYENGFYTLGRQTLLMPLEWDDNGWFKIKDNHPVCLPMDKPKGESYVHGGLLSDNFLGENLNWQWRFFDEYDTTRFTFSKVGLTLICKGENPGNSHPLLTIPVNKSYVVTVELEITDNAIGGLTLFYGPDAYTALALSKNGIGRYKLNNPTPWREMQTGKHCFFKLVNDNHQVSYFYSLDGENWNTYPSGAEVSGLHHNTFGKFRSLRVGVFATGEGEVTFKNFTYKGLDNK